jgi:hypothetical protein
VNSNFPYRVCPEVVDQDRRMAVDQLANEKAYHHGHEARINMRESALIAAIAQLLYGAFAIAPELFGVGRVPVPDQFLDWVYRSLTLVESAVLASFFFIVYRNVASVSHARAVRFASVIAALALTVENLLPTYATIGSAVVTADNALGWKYHPFNQLAYVLVPTIPTLAVISLAVFLFLLFSMSPKASRRMQGTTGPSGPLRMVAFAAAAVSVIPLAWFLYSVLAAPRLPASIVRLSLRFVTLVSLGVFFFVLGAHQQRNNLLTSAQ